MTPANSSGLFALLQLFHARLDCLAQKGGALPHLPLDHLAVETHLRWRSIRLCSRSGLPVQASARARSPVPVQGLHVIRIAPQILAPGPEHGIVDMETDRHIGLEGQTKRKLDEPGDLGVTMIKAEVPQHDGQSGLLVAYGADPPFDVLDVVAKRRLVREPGEWVHPLAHAGDFRIGTVGEDLKGQIPGLLLRLRGLTESPASSSPAPTRDWQTASPRFQGPRGAS